MAQTGTWPLLRVSNLDALLVWLDGGLCAQQASHSFWIDGRQLPLCARDLGLFAAFLLAATLAPRYAPGVRPKSTRREANPKEFMAGAMAASGFPAARLPGQFRWLFGLLPLVFDGSNSFGAVNLGLSLYAPSNVWRLASGVLAGACLALALTPSSAAWSRRALLGLALLPVLGLVNAYLAAALLGTAGALALTATANRLARPSLSAPIAWLIALPELVLLALAKQGALLLVR
jgi:hypothetical protein